MTFPSAPLGIEADLYLGAWTSMGSYIYQRDPVSITRGRPNESATISPSQCTMTLNNRDNRFTIRNPVGAWYGLIGQNTPFRLSVPNALTGGGTYLRMEDDNISNASCPDTSSLHITGTLDVRIDCQLSGYNGGQPLSGPADGAADPRGQGEQTASGLPRRVPRTQVHPGSDTPGSGLAAAAPGRRLPVLGAPTLGMSPPPATPYQGAGYQAAAYQGAGYQEIAQPQAAYSGDAYPGDRYRQPAHEVPQQEISRRGAPPRQRSPEAARSRLSGFQLGSRDAVQAGPGPRQAPHAGEENPR